MNSGLYVVEWARKDEPTATRVVDGKDLNRIVAHLSSEGFTVYSWEL